MFFIFLSVFVVQNIPILGVTRAEMGEMNIHRNYSDERNEAPFVVAGVICQPGCFFGSR